jgi:hypothetical protein
LKKFTTANQPTISTYTSLKKQNLISKFEPPISSRPKKTSAQHKTVNNDLAIRRFRVLPQTKPPFNNNLLNWRCENLARLRLGTFSYCGQDKTYQDSKINRKFNDKAIARNVGTALQEREIPWGSLWAKIKMLTCG